MRRAPPRRLATGRGALRRGLRTALRWCLLTLLASAAEAAAPAIAAATDNWPALYPDASLFLRAIELERRAPPAGRVVTGIGVPHHLLAADLIARGVQLAAGSKYRRIVLLSPDHFRRSHRPFATTRRGFATALGTVTTDQAAVAALLANDALIEASDLFATEHGVHALLPFLAHYFPDTPVVAIALRIDSREADWRALVDALKPWVDADTLIVQSTDFSHYLGQREATRRDQRTMQVIASGDLEAVARLRQPDDIDSRAAQFVHMLLQRTVHGAAPAIIGQRNSQGYSRQPESRTTSYLLQVYERPPPAMHGCAPRTAAWPAYAGERVFFFGGDTFFGRHVALQLRDPGERRRVRGAVLGVTQGAPLILNLEGVPLPGEPPRKLGGIRLGMALDTTIDWLHALNVRAVGLANNHALDFGAPALEAAKRALGEAGIEVIGQAEIADLGPFRLTALSDISNTGTKRRALATPAVFARLRARQAPLPLFALLHWGREFEARPGEREAALSAQLARASVGLIVGSHPHVASRGLELLPDGHTARAYSLGNFIFDQPGCQRDGALLEVRFFPEHTHALRWHALGNLLHPDEESRHAGPGADAATASTGPRPR